MDLKPGMILTNGSSALRLTERVEKDPRWRAPGWRGVCIPLERFGGNAGLSDFVPNHLLTDWREVPMEWTPVVGGGLEERYIWADGYRRLQREVRRCPTHCGHRPS